MNRETLFNTYMPAITITANDNQIPFLIEFCDMHKIQYDFNNYTVVDKEILPRTLKTPNSSLKYFCGSEMLTTTGQIQPHNALHFIIEYARRKNLLGVTTFGLDERLQEVFNTKETSFPTYEISQRVNALFID